MFALTWHRQARSARPDAQLYEQTNSQQIWFTGTQHSTDGTLKMLAHSSDTTICHSRSTNIVKIKISFFRKCCRQNHTPAPSYSRCFHNPSCGEPQHIASLVGRRKLKRQRPSKAHRPIRSTSRSSSRGSRRSALGASPSRRPPRLPPMLIGFNTLTPPRDGGGSRIKTRVMHHQTPFCTPLQRTQE